MMLPTLCIWADRVSKSALLLVRYDQGKVTLLGRRRGYQKGVLANLEKGCRGRYLCSPYGYMS